MQKGFGDSSPSWCQAAIPELARIKGLGGGNGWDIFIVRP